MRAFFYSKRSHVHTLFHMRKYGRLKSSNGTKEESDVPANGFLHSVLPAVTVFSHQCRHARIGRDVPSDCVPNYVKRWSTGVREVDGDL